MKPSQDCFSLDRNFGAEGMKFKRKFTIYERDEGWFLDQDLPDGNFPTIFKNTKKEIAARFLQELNLGPTAPQIGPEHALMDSEGREYFPVSPKDIIE